MSEKKPTKARKTTVGTRSGRGSRVTRQRRAILDVLRSTRSHPTAEWIHQEVRKTLPRVSLGTVYRNLKLLRDMGEITELSYGASLAHYDGWAHPHAHLRCTHCDRVDDLEEQLPEGFDAAVAEVSGWQITARRIEFEGFCPDCRKKVHQLQGSNALH